MSLSNEIAPHLPFLRRYARAITGSQKHGDAYVRAALEAILQAPKEFPRELGSRVGLYKVFQAIWGSANVDDAGEDTAPNKFGEIAQARMAAIPPLNRQALLLTAMEGFSAAEAAYILEESEDDVEKLADDASREIEKQTTTRILIIEDEPIISLDLEAIVQELGHEVTQIAATRREAVIAARGDRPGLVLADIQLADGSSGIDAVTEILNEFQVPVIFVTAYPERLLTGERPEPTFLITKPFQRNTVKAAISQALFFGSTAAPS